MPVPEPSAGFVDRALAKASGAARIRESRGWREIFARPLTWWAAAGGALAASLAWFILISLQSTPDTSRVQLALHESRDISLVIDSERALEGATIRLYVTGSVALAGYEDQQEIQWLASLSPGANLLSLPVVARGPGDGSVVAVIEHEGKTRRVSVALHVSSTVRG
jgi:hypothetical protein